MKKLKFNALLNAVLYDLKVKGILDVENGVYPTINDSERLALEVSRFIDSSFELYCEEFGEGSGCNGIIID